MEVGGRFRILVTFNSLFEIHPGRPAEQDHKHKHRLSILFLRFNIANKISSGINIQTFNSLFEILWGVAETAGNTQDSCFQFSFWDSGHDHLIREQGVQFVSFNSLFEIRSITSTKTTYRTFKLSILFLRFSETQGSPLGKVVEDFQFSFWDSSTIFFLKMNEENRPFNSLFEIPYRNNTCPWSLCDLSILFLRFHTRLFDSNRRSDLFFQFSFWDSHAVYICCLGTTLDTTFNSLFEIP